MQKRQSGILMHVSSLHGDFSVGSFGREAREFVDYRKQERLRTTAAFYLAEHETALQPRFDVIEIYAPDGVATRAPVINHLEDAFQ